MHAAPESRINLNSLFWELWRRRACL